jgi:glycosyltransferase involved in cell wall biosynthesis
MAGEYVELGHRPKQFKYKIGLCFVLPIKEQLDAFDQYSQFCSKMIYMTVCETDPVNPCYGLLARYPEVHVPSEFSRQILSKQFPTIKWSLLRHWAPEGPVKCPVLDTPYTFYTIGNVLDPRKNIKGLVDAFNACDFGSAARLVLKATCLRPVDWKIPGVVIVNGLLDIDALEKIHGSCHCYVNCSHSEGVGMGAVEAALRSKPVIISDYGGLKEYVMTPWIVPCTTGPIGFDDFLFTKDLQWGHPSKDELVKCLKDCFYKRVKTWDHTYTKNLVSQVKQDLHHLSEASPD